MLFVKLFTCDLLPLNSFASVDVQEVDFVLVAVLICSCLHWK